MFHKNDAKIQITITTAYPIRIKYPLSGFNYRLSDVNAANFNKIYLTVSEQQLFKNRTQKQKFPTWEIPISLLTARSVTSNDVMVQLTKLVTPWSFLSRNTPDFISPFLWPPNRGRSENRRSPQTAPQTTAYHRRTHCRPPPDEPQTTTGRTAEHTAGRGK